MIDLKLGARFVSVPHFAKALRTYHTGIYEESGAGMKFRDKRKFLYGVPAYTGQFQALITYIYNHYNLMYVHEIRYECNVTN
jgi:hypothetical protein